MAQKRFVNMLYQQVILHFLLKGDKSPLNIFGPNLAMGLSDNQLEQISGEDDESKKHCATLEREITSLKTALKVLWEERSEYSEVSRAMWDIGVPF